MPMSRMTLKAAHADIYAAEDAAPEAAPLRTLQAAHSPSQDKPTARTAAQHQPRNRLPCGHKQPRNPFPQPVRLPPDDDAGFSDDDVFFDALLGRRRSRPKAFSLPLKRRCPIRGAHHIPQPAVQDDGAQETRHHRIVFWCSLPQWRRCLCC